MHLPDPASIHRAALARRSATDARRPIWHLAPPGGWMNDPNGLIYSDGWYHAHYQHNPFADTWATMHWGHARSRDLVHWEHLPIALAPAIAEGEEHCFSGCAIARGMDYDLVYTSVAFAGLRPHRQVLVREGQRLPLHLSGLGDEARDPFVFSWGGRRHMAVGDGPRVAWFTQSDPEGMHWEPKGDLWRGLPGLPRFSECPTIIPLGSDPDEHLLLISPYGPVEWRRGRLGSDGLAVASAGRFDLGDRHYATTALADVSGRWTLVGWIRGFAAGTGWNGCLAAPRLVEADSGGIRQRFHPCIDLLSTSGHAVSGQVAHRRILPVTVSARMRGRISAPAALRCCGADLSWDGVALRIADQSSMLTGVGLELEIDLLVDRGVVEVLADFGRYARTVVLPTSDGTGGTWIETGGTVDLIVTELRL